MKDMKKAVAEEIWLHYLNDYLFEHGVITQEAHSRAAVQINRRGRSNGTEIPSSQTGCGMLQ